VTGWEIVEIDAKDEARLSEWWHASRAADTGRPYDFWPTWEVARAYYRTDDPNTDTTMLAAYVDGEIAGAARLRYPLKDNTHLTWAMFGVLEPFRRRGIGTALVAAGEDDARDHGRNVLLADVKTPPGATSGGHLDFAAKVGFEPASMEEHKALDLAGSEHLWPALDAEVAEAIGDYRIEVWTEIPEEHLDGYCGLLNIFMSQIPTGDLPLEDLHWDRARIRANEARAREIGLVEFTSAAIAPDGSLAASSDVNINVQDPRIADIGITLVLPEHRGHRLGLAVKLANHRALRAAYPQTELVTTTNANVNAHMNAINERMGYRVVEQFHELQKKL
jgi:GNAT superfamily N-acetyltransferase